jgi:hypothetical protein
MVIQDKKTCFYLDAHKTNLEYFKKKKSNNKYNIEKKYLLSYFQKFVITSALMIAISLFIKVKNQLEE